MSSFTKGVHGLHNLASAIIEKELNMGYQRKKTPEALDKIIQFIWYYQNENGGASPAQSLIALEAGVAAPKHYIALLEDAKRLEVISARPYRVRILEHPKNRAAIKKLQKTLEAAAALEAQSVPNPEPSVAAQTEAPTLAENYAQASLDQLGNPELTADRVSTRVASPTANLRFTGGVQNWAQASRIIELHGGDLESIAKQYILATAKSGDLLEALLDRGYTILKTHPNWRN